MSWFHLVKSLRAGDQIKVSETGGPFVPRVLLPYIGGENSVGEQCKTSDQQENPALHICSVCLYDLW